MAKYSLKLISKNAIDDQINTRVESHQEVGDIIEGNDVQAENFKDVDNESQTEEKWSLRIMAYTKIENRSNLSPFLILTRL